MHLAIEACRGLQQNLYIPQILILSEDYFFIGRKRLNYLAGVARCHHYIGKCLDGCRSVYITYHRISG